MNVSISKRLLGALFATALFATACGGGGDDASNGNGSADNGSSESILDDGGSEDATDSESVPNGPVDGLITVRAGLGLGLYAIDRGTGETVAFNADESLGFLDRQTDFIWSDGAAYILGFAEREDQNFSYDVSVAKVDIATGGVSKLVELGFDREKDDSETSVSYTLEAVFGDSLVVRSGEFGGEDTYRVYDSNTGAELSSFGPPIYEEETDSGTCSSTVSGLLGLTDGRLAGIAFDQVVFVDPATGEVELTRECGVPTPELRDFVTAEEIDAYVVFNEGDVPDEDGIERLLDLELELPDVFVEGDGDLWWLNVSSRAHNDISSIVGGVVQFDLASGTIEAVHSLGEHIGIYGECPDADGECNSQTLQQAQMRYVDGQVVMLDGDENGRLVILDPATGEVSATELLTGDGVDYTRADLLAGDPSGVWLEVNRMTITKDDDTGRTASGPAYIERFDLLTRTIDLSLAAQDIFGL